MISLQTARALREAGLRWIPAKHDFFAIPDRGFDDQIFVISDMTIQIRLVQEQLAVTFEGAVEWALDHILAAELVWLPSESQLRGEIEERLHGGRLRLTTLAQAYRCEVEHESMSRSFEANSAEEAYGAALLHILRERPPGML